MSLRVATRIAELRRMLEPFRRAGAVIGFVPTMGALHAGHGALLQRARSECRVVVASIFVNPIQFNQASDYELYPRTPAADLDFCREHGADVVFAPSAEEMYPAPLDTCVEVRRLTDHLCGAFRPGHFRGVATVVAKLFHIVQPDKAYFGEKDAQQLAVIRRMVRDLNMPVEIVAVPTVREPGGLALSSRNQRLNERERRTAEALYRALQAAAQAVAAGERSPAAVLAPARAVLEAQPELRLEYLEVVDAEEMVPVQSIRGPVRVALAAWIGGVRLIDNILCDVSGPPQG